MTVELDWTYEAPRVHRAADLIAQPWANGKGMTRTVVGAADGAWRISIATVTAAAEFSVYEGFARQIMPLAVSGMNFLVNGHHVHLPQYSVFDFSGSDDVTVKDVVAPMLDLNVFTRRGSYRSSLRMLTSPRDLNLIAGLTVVMVLSNGISYDDTRLDELDAVVLAGPGRLRFDGVGTVAVAEISHTS